MTKHPHPAALRSSLGRSLFVASTLAASTLLAAQTNTSLSQLSDQQLEQRFWDCDALATRQLLAPGDGIDCVIWQDELKRRHFDGDFGKLLVWWRERKGVEHARRLAATDTQAP